MQSTIHNPSQLNQFEPHFRGVTDAVESESIPEVACCRTLVQRSYSTHSVVIPKNPVLIADADAHGALKEMLLLQFVLDSQLSLKKVLGLKKFHLLYRLFLKQSQELNQLI